ncbi:MAG TPA: Gfo/Idh/MocA family oxidoreductase [Opitutaceae bacterium]|nr:Gfo/Idh/MocA family oxidoreductase [Opitutaceae bacterium]
MTKKSSSRSRPLRIAVIGTGGVAQRNYLPFLAAQPDVAIACWNRTAAKAKAAARVFGGEAFPTLAAMAAWKPTAALVLTAETCRHEVGAGLIAAGVPRVFFEKPLVAVHGQARVEEGDFFKGRDLLALAARRKCETAMVFNYRFFEQSLAAKEIARSRKFGRVIGVTAQVHYACWSHVIDLIHHFAGGLREITALSGPVERTGDRVGTARDVTAAFVTDDGAAGTIVGTAGMKWQHPLYELTFTFEQGRLHLRDLDGTLEILDGKRQLHETVSFVRDNSRWANYDESFRKALGAYLDSLRTRRPPPVPGIDGLRELQAEAALKRSIKERRPVELAREFPLRLA